MDCGKKEARTRGKIRLIGISALFSAFSPRSYWSRLRLFLPPLCHRCSESSDYLRLIYTKPIREIGVICLRLSLLRFGWGQKPSFHLRHDILRPCLTLPS
jgi:hypothetical protein